MSASLDATATLSHLGLLPGARVDRFVLETRLGQGGQGEVWKAHDGLSHRHVALKLVSLQAGAMADPERTRREARRLAQLTHPGLVRCTGLFEDLERGLTGLVLEFIEGGALSDVLGDPRLTQRHREAALWQVAQALVALQAAGIVHRDLKPENVLLSPGFWEAPFAPGAVKVVDLGIAVDVGNTAPLTQPMMVLGTPASTAPEALDPGAWGGDSRTTPAADVFAFGVLGWRLLAGGHPTGLPPSATAVDYAVAYRAAGRGQTPWPATKLEHPWADALKACLTLSPSARRLPLEAFSSSAGASSNRGHASLQNTRPAIPVSVSTLPWNGAPAMAGQTTPDGKATVAQEPLRASLTPQPTPPRRGRPWLGLLLGGALAMLGLGIASLALFVYIVSDPSKPRSAPSALPPRALPAPTATTPPTDTPEPGTCRCDAAKAALACGAGRSTMPLDCHAPLPLTDHWRLRLSHVRLKLGGKSVNLAEAFPGATVTLCIAGTRICETTPVRGIRVPECGRASSLPVTTADLVSSGLDVTVMDASGTVLGTASGVHHSSIGTLAACEGLIFGKRQLGASTLEQLGLFLDSP